MWKTAVALSVAAALTVCAAGCIFSKGEPPSVEEVLDRADEVEEVMSKSAPSCFAGFALFLRTSQQIEWKYQHVGEIGDLTREDLSKNKRLIYDEELRRDAMDVLDHVLKLASRAAAACD